MKRILLLVLLAVMCLPLYGCVEPFVAGFGTGVATYEKIAQDKQAEFNATVATLTAKKAEMDILIAQVEDGEVKTYLQDFVDKETIANIEQIKSADWGDPKVVTGFALALVGSLTAGYQKFKTKKG